MNRIIEVKELNKLKDVNRQQRYRISDLNTKLLHHKQKTSFEPNKKCVNSIGTQTKFSPPKSIVKTSRNAGLVHLSNAEKQRDFFS